METIRAGGEFYLVTGHLKKLFGCDELGVPGNKADISTGGNLLRELLATKDWVQVNALDPTIGGLSCLNMFVVSRKLRPYIDKLVIDSDREMSVVRAVRQRVGAKLVYSDHFTCLLTLHGLPERSEKQEKVEAKWNLAKVGGWSRYKELTDDELSEKLDKVVTNENTTKMEDYTAANKLHLNPEKTKIMLISKNQEMKIFLDTTEQ